MDKVLIDTNLLVYVSEECSRTWHVKAHARSRACSFGSVSSDSADSAITLAECESRLPESEIRLQGVQKQTPGV